MSAVFSNTQAINYAVTGGDTDIEIQDKNGDKLDLTKYDILYVQVDYKDLDVGDSTLTFKRSADGVRYVTPPSSTLTMSTGSAKVNDFNHSVFGAKFARISFTHGTDAAGTIESVHVIAKSKS